MHACKLCGEECHRWQVFCGAACSAGWEMGQRPATPPEPAAPPRVTPEDWQHLLEAQETAREIGERLAKMRERFGLDAPGPDEAERVAREHLGVTVVTKYTRAAVDDLATLLRAAEARGRERGLAEGIVIGEAHENERVALYVASLLGDGHDVPRRIRQLGRK